MGVVENRWKQAAETLGYASARDMFARWPGTDKELSKILGWTPTAVSARRNLLGLRRSRKRIDWEAEATRLGFESLEDMLENGTGLAAKIGCHPVTILTKRKAYR